jgi:hypothetical protein
MQEEDMQKMSKRVSLREPVKSTNDGRNVSQVPDELEQQGIEVARKLGLSLKTVMILNSIDIGDGDMTQNWKSLAYYDPTHVHVALAYLEKNNGRAD